MLFSHSLNISFFLSLSLTESLSCNQCKRTERCLPDLITNKPVCVSCKRPNGRCPIEVRRSQLKSAYIHEFILMKILENTEKMVNFNLFNCSSLELTFFIAIIIIIVLFFSF